MNPDRERAIRHAIDVLGVCHLAEEGPGAGWREVEGELLYDDDLRCRADCPVCIAAKGLEGLLALPDPVRDAAREVVEHAQDARKVFAEELIERAIVLRPETFYALRAALEESEHE